MKITVFADKMERELLGPFKRTISDRKLSRRELQVVVERLRGGEGYDQMAARIGITAHNFSILLQHARARLLVEDDMELALLAYERGYVTVSEE